MSNSMKIIRHLPCAPFPATKAAYKKPVLYNNSKHMRVVELPCQYNPRPIQVPKKKPTIQKEKRLDKTSRIHKRQKWTDEKIQKVIDMYNNGASYIEIGKAIGRSSSNVHKKIHMLIANGELKERRDKRCRKQPE